MLTLEESIQEAEALSVEERALVVDTLLRSIHRPSAAVDAPWKQIAIRRIEELRKGDVKAVPGEDVFRRIHERFE